MIAETKLDETFPDSQFIMPGMKKPYRLDISASSGGLLVYVDKNISSKRIFSSLLPDDIQVIILEINIKNRRLLILCLYRPPKQKLNYFVDYLSDLIDKFSETYTDVMVIGDFNEEPTSNTIKTFMDGNQFKNLMKTKTCFKKESGRCIDLILTNKKGLFQFSNTFETGCSDHHLMIHTMMKLKFIKLPPKKISYRDFSTFNSEKYTNEVESKIAQDETDLAKLNRALEDIMNKHAPLKTKIVRENNQAHMTKELRKEIMTRSRLKNTYNKSKNLKDLDAFKRQRNRVVAMNRKQKKLYFENLSVEKRNNSNDFWSYCKPFFSNKSTIWEENISLFENENLIIDDKEIAHILNEYFKNITKYLPITDWNTTYDDETTDDKFASHPSIKIIKQIFRHKKVSLSKKLMKNLY